MQNQTPHKINVSITLKFYMTDFLSFVTYKVKCKHLVYSFIYLNLKHILYVWQ